MNLLELREAIAEDRIKQAGRTALVWGEPRTGKTRWVSSIAKSPQIKEVFFLDYENGAESIVHAKNKDGTSYLTDEELAKIHLIRVMDLPDIPRAYRTTELLFRRRNTTTHIHTETGDFHKTPTDDGKCIQIRPEHWTEEYAFVLDTIGQIGTSAYNKAVLELPEAKDPRRWYGQATIDLNNLFTMIQACPAYVIGCTHILEKEIVLATDKSGNPTRIKTDQYPLCLSKNYSMNVGKFFGSIIYRYIELNKFAHLSSPIKKSGIQAGTRTDVDVSTDLDMTLPQVLKLMQQQIAEVEATAKPSLRSK